MKKKKKRAWLGAFLCLALLAGCWGGCGQKEEAGKPEESRGRYVEKQEPLPDMASDGWVTKQLFVADGTLNLLLAKKEGENTILSQWARRGDAFEDVSPAWMAGMQVPAEPWTDMALLQGKEGTQYLFLRSIGEEGFYRGYLYQGREDRVQDITPEQWAVPDEEYGMYPYIEGIAALDNGTLAALSPTSLDLLSGEDGSIRESQAISASYGEELFSDGESIYLTAMGGGYGVAALEKWPEGKQEQAAQIPLPEENMSGVAFCFAETGVPVAAAAQGIFRYNQVSESWEKLIEGSETDFALSTSWCTGLAAMEDGRIYALFRQEDGTERLMKYEYDPDAVTEVTKELTLYTVWENSLLQQAAVSYHRAHPDVLITIEYAYAAADQYSGKTPDYGQVYQALNTRLMGEDAPDILVMDHLNIESYAQKGLLADIDEAVAPLEESGELMSNITGAYRQEDGSRYVVPLEFGFNMAVGREIGQQDMASLSALASYLKERQESYLGPMTVSELVNQFYPFFCGEIVKDDALDREKMEAVLMDLKAIGENSGIVEKHEEDDRKYNYWDLTYRAKLAYTECSGFFDCMSLISIREYIKGEFCAFENCFLPALQTGINSQSEYLETAMDFLKFALSQEVQDTDQYGGFPVNRVSLEKMAAADRSEMAAETEVKTEDGGFELFEISPFSEEAAGQIVEICKSLDRPIREDEKIREELVAALPGYLDGSRTLEETLDSLEGGLKMYLAE